MRPLNVSVVDRYQRLQLLGAGGFGTVHEAVDRTTYQRVALKELYGISPAQLTHFKQEFRHAREVLHENLVRLEALFEERGRWVIAMERIEGTDLCSYLHVDGGERRFDEARLRSVFLQLTEGLCALHDSGLLHRDLKPGNVRVTPTGRVVLLDFGFTLAADAQLRCPQSGPGGSLAYKAPEQLRRQALTPATDFYALGVCLYEVLTGMVPGEAAADFDPLAFEARTLPVPPAELAVGVPDDLNALCCALLAIEPERRPFCEKIKTVLRSKAEPSMPSPFRQIATAHHRAFEGRERELLLLAQALNRAEQGAPQLAVIEGESGIGKSELAEHFLLRHTRAALCLRGRCYESELLSYKAFDGPVDALSAHLSRLSPHALPEVLPPNAGLLGRLFPPLHSLQAVADADVSALPAEPTAQRLAAFHAFASLLARLSARRPIIIAIDDLQWADAESFQLLHVCLAAARARCLFVVTVRPSNELEAEIVSAVRSLCELRCATRLHLSGLSPAHTRALICAIGGAALSEATLERIALESDGHPLFVRVLVHHALVNPELASKLTLEHAIAARLQLLEPNARTLAEVVALSGAPLLVETACAAAAIDAADVSRLCREVVRMGVLRRRRIGELASYHDQIRNVVLRSMTPERSRDHHARLAAALQAQGNADVAALAHHHDGAGQLAPAYKCYRAAAQAAIVALAFARASALYGRCRELAHAVAAPAAEQTELLIDHGHSLAHSGRSEAAARLFLRAADLKPEQGPQLRLLGAQHLLQAAHVAEGLSAARALLSEAGVPLPTTTMGVLAHTAWDRGLRALGLGGVMLGPARDATGIRLRLNALARLALPILWLDPAASVALSARYVRLSLAEGEPSHMARALGEEAYARASRDASDLEADRLLARARALFVRSPEPVTDVCLAFYEGAVALLRWQLPLARERFEHGHRVCVERCPQEPWLLTNLRIALGSTAAYVGDYAWLSSQTVDWLHESRERDDRFGLLLLEGFGHGFVRHLMAGSPDQARAAMDAALDAFPRLPFSFVHFGEMHCAVQSELYRGGSGALAWMDQERSRLRRAFVMRMPFTKASVLMLRATASIAALESATRVRAQLLLGSAQADLRALQRLAPTLRTAHLHGLALQGQLLAIEGRTEAAVAVLHEAMTDTRRAGYAYLYRCCDHFAGWLEGGDAGMHRQRTALAFFAEQGWADPRRAVAMWCPAGTLLESRGTARQAA